MAEDSAPKETTPQEASATAEEVFPSDSPRLQPEGVRTIEEAVAEMPRPGEPDYDEAANDAPIVRMANAILSTGIDSRASAIYCEPDRRSLRVRIRVDGVMMELMAIPKHIEPPITRRYFIMSDLNPFARYPQTGTIPIKHNNQDYTVRLSSLPSLCGISQVLKIYRESMATLGVDNLGMVPVVQAGTEDLIARPGLFLITGPADSGRTTTAYRLLYRLNVLERNTLSVEDMPGYRLPGVTQIYSRRMRGISHAEAIASARNLMPDTLFVGDITSRDAAEEAVSAAESGITVIGVIGAMDAVGGIQALMRLGISPDRIAGAVSGILAQQLVRLLCIQCRRDSDKPVPDNLRFNISDFWNLKSETFLHAPGCDACKQRGYWDRLGIFELLPMTNGMRDTLSETVTPSRLRDAALSSSTQTLASVAWEWAAAGVISYEEARRVEASLPSA